MPAFQPTPFGGPNPSRSKRVGAALALLIVVGALAWTLGPRNPMGDAVASARALPPENVAIVSDWVRDSEAAIPDIKPGNAKGIVWAGTPGQRTAWSVVYVHGFSASRLETAPLAETVANQLGANVFYTRLTGHGRLDGDAMGEAKAQDWMADTLEAARIGQALGERVLMISCSTGSTLATWLGTSGDASRVAAHVFISPNFGPKDKRSEIINAPWGQKIALWIEGPTRSWIPENPQEGQAWTPSYPTKAVFPMMALVKNVRDSDLSLFRTPVQVLYSESDQTVDVAESKAAFTRLGSAHKSMEPVTYSRSKGQHVLAGNIKDPAAVAPMADSIVQWLKTLPKEAF